MTRPHKVTVSTSETDPSTPLIASLLLVALAGCNTVAGIGDDISAGARAVQNQF